MKKVVLIIIISILVLIGLFLYLFLFNDHIELILNGEKNLNLEVFTNYEDLGITLKNNKKEIPHNKYTLHKNSNLNTNIIGNYLITYNIKYKNKDYSISRNINVIDKTPPIITVNIEEIEKDYCTKKISSNLKYTANDNYDGDLTDKIETLEDNDFLILKIKDSSNNETTKNIKINYKEKPKNNFTLIGNSTIYVPLNNTYNENSTKYTDGCGNKLNNNVKITNNVNTNEMGTYQITYELPNEKTLTRKVIVYNPATTNLNDNTKIIYLTFDDGPGYYTNKILNILDKYNIKATFFVTNQFPSYTYLIKTEYDKGHKIALHTYTHKYDIYTSIDTYLNDFNKMNEVIKEYTGSYTNLFRFPGGSSNTVSRSLNKGIMTELANKMQSDGYIYFDWNVSSGDASNANSTNIYNNVVNGVKKCNKCIVLMHDIKGTTANALDNILNTLTNYGYTFSVLDENSPTAHHGINN